MEYDAFQGGVKAGGLFNINLVRILLCYLLTKFGKPLNKDILFEAIQNEELANYFEIMDSYIELVKCNHIIEKDNICTVTETGKMISNQLDDELPVTVKEKALSAILKLLIDQKNKKENQVVIKDIENGKIVNCKIPGDENICLFELNLYVPDDMQAQLVKRNFYRAPDVLYKLLLATLTEDDDMLEIALADFHRSQTDLKK